MKTLSHSANSEQVRPVNGLWLALPVALALAAGGLLLSSARIARADMAPFPAQSGTGIGVASPTNIQMISETVLLSVVPFTRSADNPNPSADLGAKVVADFALLNPSNSAQNLKVGFPLEVPAKAAGAGGYIKLSNLKAIVGGTEAETQITTVGNETWSAWQMSFKPGLSLVRVTYDLPATTDSCNAELGYVLHTGAAWAGPIGQADLIVRYPYAAETTFVSPKGIYLGDTTPGFGIEGSDLHWHYDSLEPTAANDLAVTFVTPDCWLKVAEARNALNQQPTAENYWHLANTYAEIVFPHHGFYSPLIAQVADAQYQKALRLDPENPQIISDYAEFLAFQVGQLLPASRVVDMMRECNLALQLNPNDDLVVADCGYGLSSHIDDKGVPPEVRETAIALLTPQPTATLMPRPTATPLPTATIQPAAIGSPTAAPTALPILTASPRSNATSTPVAIAQVTVAGSPTPLATPVEQSSNGPAWTIGLIALVGLILVAGVFVLRRQRHS